MIEKILAQEGRTGLGFRLANIVGRRMSTP